MTSASFQRLPIEVQDIVTLGLEDEIQTAFELIGEAKKSGSLSVEEIRFLEGDILRASGLRARLTGEESPTLANKSKP
ncbi:hypothetical protein [Leucobacter luti]|uniref:Uncharacterized protein n=1 Tax=Leucobacter luti TaxID=340320 RepID=A0A4R6S8F0_9MICO|nr:hypothetical protein [Leucobacter luti]MCW2288667.1 hypothetical protein [Leucobacter luti]QYM75409.1 hypothetical protein K1X41_12325 [Leucobacter luti]TCK45178.1 hypothetical protein EDF60_0403 [Leucobacter luti]TDP95703.1 hypothetical protein EDF62_0397 [Leucobacter luti]